MIRAVRLKRWKSHEYSEASFGKGTSVIIGPMGAGKSCILEGMCFAFYGTTPQVKSRRVKLEELVMNSPHKFEEASVEVWFDAGGKNYSVERTINAKSPSVAHLREEGKVIESGPQRVTENVERLLQVDYELFVRAVYSEQNKIDYFLELGKSERKKQTDELLGIAEFETARSNATTVVNKLKALKAQAESFIAGANAAELEKDARELKAAVDAAEREASECESKRKIAEEKARSLAAAVAELERQEGVFNKLQGELQAANALAGQVEARLAEVLKRNPQRLEAAEAAALKARLQKEIAACKAALAEGQRLSGQLEAAAAQATLLQQQLERKPSLSLEEANAKKTVVEACILRTRSELQETNARVSELKTRAAEAKQAAVRKERVEKELASITAQLTEAQAALKALPATDVPACEKAAAEAAATVNSATEAARLLEGTTAACPVCESALDGTKVAELAGRKQTEINAAALELEEREKTLKEALDVRGRTDEIKRNASILASKAGSLTAEVEILAKTGDAAKAAAEADAGEARVKELMDALENGNAELAAVLQAAVDAKEWLDAKDRLAQALKVRVDAEEKLKACGKATPQELEGLQTQLDAAEDAEELAGVELQKKSLQAKTMGVQEAFAKLAFQPGGLKEKRLEGADATTDAAVLKEKAAALAVAGAEKRARLAEVDKQLGLVREQEARKQLLEKRVEGMAKFSNALVETQAAMRNELLGAINASLEEFWPQVYPYRDYSGARLSASEDDYFLELRKRDAWVAAENASGGERSCAALALRAAFATVLTPDLNWLVLDEPTHNLDSHAVELLCTTLRDGLPQVIGQVFVITHDEALKEGASTRLYRVERDKDKGDNSTIEEVEA